MPKAMRVYSRRPNPAAKDQQPFVEPAHRKGSEKPAPFFGKAGIHRKEEPGKKPADEEMKGDLKNQNKELEKEKAQTKEKDEEKQVQKKSEDKQEEMKDPKAQEPKKEEKEPVKKKSIHRKELTGSHRVVRRQGQEGAQEASAELEQRLQTSKGKGFSLPDDFRKEMNDKFNHDFSRVTIHTDAEAVSMAEELEALAFTHGNDIYFNLGQYNPYSPAGKELLVHELTHVVQQER
jgi:hypothetical protein